MPDFLPRRDADLRDWSASFSKNLSQTPGAFGVSAQQAAGFAALQQAYAHRYAVAMSPQTRTVVNIQAKDAARDAMVALARELAGVVRSRRATTNAQLVELGLRKEVAGRGRQRVPRPGVAPLIYVRRVMGRRMWLRVSASVGFSEHNKPADASMLTLLFAVGARPPARMEGYAFWQVTGKTRLVFEAPASVRPGEQVWLVGSWMNDRGEQGPWSPPVPGRVDYGGGPAVAGASGIPGVGGMRRAA